MMKIGIMVAMDKEYRQLCHLGNDSIRVCKTGIGKVNAAVNTLRLISEFKPDLVISSGCAGGASGELDVMDMVIGTRVVYHDVYCCLDGESYGQIQGMPLYYEAPREVIDLAASLDYQHKVHTGLIASGDWFVDTLDKIDEILGHFPDAKAIDMESGAIAQTCHIMGVPFVATRMISDVPVRGNNKATYDNFWDTIADKSFGFIETLIEKLQQP